MADLEAVSLDPKAGSESWSCYRERILTAFQKAGNDARRMDEAKVAFNRRVNAWAKSTSTVPPRLPRNVTESLRSYRERIRTAFYEEETRRSYHQRIRAAEGKVAFNRRVKAWADGKTVVPMFSLKPTAVTGYVMPKTPDGTKHVAFLEHPLFHTAKVIMHMRHICTDEYNGLYVSSVFCNNDDGTEHVYIRHNNYWGAKVVLRRLDFVDNPAAPVLDTYLSYEEPGGITKPARNVVWQQKYNRGGAA